MIDDHKYSIGRTVVYKHLHPKKHTSTFGQYGPERTVGIVREVRLSSGETRAWEYVVENLINRESTMVPERDIMFATVNRRKDWQHGDASMHLKFDAEKLAEAIHRRLTKSALTNYLKTTIKEFIRKEESEERARVHGRDLPLEEGDYIRVKGDLREDIEPFHNYYAKILKVEPADIGGIEARPGRKDETRVHKVVKKFTVLLEDGTETHIYDPEVKLYYTAEGRKTILNWRAATFLAESFGDDPPYSVEYSFLEDHVFTREEIQDMPVEQLTELFAALLYVKGHMGLRDYEKKGHNLEDIPREYLIDNILSTSRFNMRKNRSMTDEEIESKRKEVYRLRRILKR